jgi:cellulose biosynthesis protein BcsQ
MHRELAAAASARFPGMLAAAIPYTADVERMGLAREPVPAFAPRSEAAKAYQSLWAEVAMHLWPSRATR